MSSGCSVPVVKIPTIVTVTTAVPVVTVATPGPQGSQGPPGAAGGAGYHHVQSAATSLWQIPHGLGYPPNVTAHTTDGTRISYDRIEHPTVNIAELTFDVHVAGYANAS